ncbi:hypothetical protein [Nitrosopumilus sp.]|uniref:hypothetical protein n=1 Tax=Nitrosopumilus sp. TaxID=2024843 RepID=UPI003B5C1DBE
MRFIIAIIASVMVFIGIQTIIPFPYGLVLGVLFATVALWYAKSHPSTAKDSILNYRRVDPINEREKKQNDEALRVLEKKYIEEKISKEEYLQRKKDFEDTEYNPRKCSICGSEDFEFVSEKRIEEIGEAPSDVGYYRCKRCGAK